MNEISHPAAVFFDAYGTIISMQQDISPPEYVHQGLAERGVRLPATTVARAVAIEATFFRERQVHVHTPEQLAELRMAAAGVLRDALGGDEACPLSLDVVLGLILGAFKTVLLPDAPEAIARVRRAGMAAGVLSNFSYVLPLLLQELQIRELLDPIVTSADVGAEKPSPEIFEAAAARVGAPVPECVLIGDDLANDIDGARAVGMPSIWIARDGAPAPSGVLTARTLVEAVTLTLTSDWRRFSLT